MSKPRLVDLRLAKTLLLFQAVMIPTATLSAWLLQGGVAAKSALAGAVLCWFASAYFAWQSFKTSGARAGQQIFKNMYVGMVGKFVIVVVGFIVILSSVSPISMVAMLGGFILVQAMAWVAPFWANKLKV